MSLYHLKLADITESDLQRLVTDDVPESKMLEYKEMLVLATDDQKRELLCDLSALANTDGGDVVYGIKEAERAKGVAAEVVGLNNMKPDAEKQRIENLLRDSIQPRVSGVAIREILLDNGKHVLIVRMPRSLSAPHMMRHQGITRFCGRNANGKYDLDVHELRSAFVANENFGERLKAFRLERINRLLSGNGPVSLTGEYLIVMHLLPVAGVRSDFRVTTADLQRIRNEGRFRPIGSDEPWGSLNFDGLLSAARSGQGCHSYVQIMRNGCVEAADSKILSHYQRPGGGSIPSAYLEREVIEALKRYLNTLSEAGAQPPFLLSLSLLNVRGYAILTGNRSSIHDTHPVDRDHLLADEVLIENTSEEPAAILQPVFDQVWNACGWPRSMNYDEAGRWRENQ